MFDFLPRTLDTTTGGDTELLDDDVLGSEWNYVAHASELPSEEIAESDHEVADMESIA